MMAPGKGTQGERTQRLFRMRMAPAYESCIIVPSGGLILRLSASRQRLF